MDLIGEEIITNINFSLNFPALIYRNHRELRLFRYGTFYRDVKEDEVEVEVDNNSMQWPYSYSTKKVDYVNKNLSVIPLKSKLRYVGNPIEPSLNQSKNKSLDIYKQLKKRNEWKQEKIKQDKDEKKEEFIKYKEEMKLKKKNLKKKRREISRSVDMKRKRQHLSKILV